MCAHSADTAHTFSARTAYAANACQTAISDGKMIATVKRKRAFGYCRVSTDMQAQFGFSLEAQQNQIAAYARAYDYEVIGFYVDHDSAKNVTGRPEYQKMIAEVDKGKVEFIISTALDRFSRSQRDFLAFQDDY